MADRIIPTPKRIVNDLSWRRFGKLLVLGYAGKSTHSQWLVQCDCGKKKVVLGIDMVAGKSCGCGQRWNRSTHRLSKTPEYRAWSAMLCRCGVFGTHPLARYGGRGIYVCESWLRFENFIADMGPMPAAGYTIERVDNDGNYCPENCRWATRMEQSRNKSNNIFVEWADQRLILTDWATKLGLTRATLSRRYHAGERPPRLFRPAKVRRRPIEQTTATLAP